MGESVKKEVKREIILALMIFMIFVCLVVTWTILGAVDNYAVKQSSSRGTQATGYAPQGTGRVALQILPVPNEGENE